MTTVNPNAGVDWSALGIRSTDTASAATTAASTAKKTALDQNDFMKLLTTQLKNQDPLKPVENEAFVAQMAQFSSLQGISDMNTKLASILSTLGENQLGSATALVGKYALTQSKTALQDANGAVFGKISVPTGATNATVSIKDSAGVTLRTMSLGSTTGDVDFAWDGKDANGNAVTPGKVTVEATAMVGGKSEALSSSVFALVQAVNLPNASNSAVTLDVAGVGAVGLDKIQKVSS